MVSKDFWVLLAMVIYFVAMLIIGFVYSKRSNSSTRQYFAGGRGVGPWLTVGPGHRHLSELETRGPTSTSLFGGRR